MSKASKQQTKELSESEVSNMRLEILSQEYQKLYEQTLKYKESLYKITLATSDVIRYVTSSLLDLDVKDDVIRDQINTIIKSINQVNKTPAQPLAKESNV